VKEDPTLVASQSRSRSKSKERPKAKKANCLDRNVEGKYVEPPVSVLSLKHKEHGIQKKETLRNPDLTLTVSLSSNP